MQEMPVAPELERSTGASAADSAGEALRANAHPLDPLSAAEVVQAANIVRAAHDLGAGMRFETIVLRERDGLDPNERLAFVSTYDIATGNLFEAIVSLRRGAVESWTPRPGAKPRIAPDEFLLAEQIAKADPRFVAALAKRGITDLSLVCSDPWSCGVFGHADEEGRRLIQTITWVRNRPFDNHYAHPVEGLSAVVDINRGEVLRIDDYGVVPVPREEANYTARFQQSWRSGLKPIEVIQPEGPSFTVDGWSVAWCGWSFRIGFTPREGLVLHDLKIRDGDAVRSILKRASLAEMVVPYGHPAGVHPRKNAFDCGEYGIGVLANSLKLGCDCLGAIHYFDGVVNRIDGSAQVIENAICLHEEDCGILWKHTDFRTEETDVRRSRRLVISFVATVGNYEYGFYWHLYLDGTIELDVRLTGIVNTAGLTQSGETGRGTRIGPGVVGHIHQHVFNVRLDMAVDGPNNTVLEVDTVADPAGPENPWHNALAIEETPLLTELAARRRTDPSRMRFWKIVNRERTTALGHHPGYRLTAGSALRTPAAPESQVGRRAGFVTHDIWVTPTSEAERWPAGDYVNQSAPGQGLPAWTAQDRPVADRPITVWHSFGHHHVVRPEDYPVQPAAHCGFLLQPFGFFDLNPTLDIPPAKSAHSCCA
jgi:primary-amine oxidase